MDLRKRDRVSLVIPPVRVAKDLVRRGQNAAALAVLRGAVARAQDPASKELLDAMLANEPVKVPLAHLRLSIRTVENWARAGFLVEALALSVALDVTTHALPQVLAELLAPVPPGVEKPLDTIHDELLTGGATIVLTMLSDAPGALPRWATRRLELLRWLLLDNAPSGTVESRRAQGTSTLARAVQPRLSALDLAGALTAARAALKETTDLHVARVVSALELLQAEVDRQVPSAPVGSRTVPLLGRPAAALQVQMVNLEFAAKLYRHLALDEFMRKEILEAIEVVQRVIEGRTEAVLDFATCEFAVDLPTRQVDLRELPLDESRRSDEFDDPLFDTIEHPPDQSATRPRSTLPPVLTDASEEEDDAGFEDAATDVKVLVGKIVRVDS